MSGRETNWVFLVQAALLLGLFELAAELAGAWGRFPFRPDWFWCLAMFASLNAPPLPAIIMYALCGLARDLLIGSRIGAGALSFIAIGWLALRWRQIAVPRNWLHQALTAGLGAFAAACLRLTLEIGRPSLAAWDDFALLAIGQGVFTLAAYGPAALFFSLPPLRLRGERKGFL
jgi:rod shape-determining protein MreD